MKTCVFPTSSDTSGLGVSETLEGIGFKTTLVVFGLLQAARKTQLKKIYARDVPETILPMNPSTKGMKTLLFWKTLSVEAEHSFGNL
jgi:hypothetical protein